MPRRKGGYPRTLVTSLMAVWLVPFGSPRGTFAAPVSSRVVNREASQAGGRSVSEVSHPLSQLSVWDNGLSEMSYYRATDRIYGRDRPYTRIHLVNRQWMNSQTGVKGSSQKADDVAVFKLNMTEQIPTENYNYRYLTTVFLKRPDLSPFKMVCSSQEWCGATFKHLRWKDGTVRVRSFSYFSGEADRSWQLAGDVVPFEALFLIARDVAAAEKPRKLKLFSPMRSTHQVEPTPRQATLVPNPAARITVPAGTFSARRVEVQWDGPAGVFFVEAVPPYRLLRYQADRVRAELLQVERRAYWDRSKTSSFYQQNHAP